MNLSNKQLAVIESPLDSSLFLTGPAGSGKTTSGFERLNYLLQSGVPGKEILLFFPQRNLGAKYQQSLNSLSDHGFSLPVLATYGGLARRIIDLFWPSIIDNFPDLNPDLEPTFLTLESSLYFLSRIIDPLITNEGYFSTVVIQRNRLYSQILDNLNKSAVHSFPHTEISDRLVQSWIGDPNQTNIYQQAQRAANDFREYCYQNNLLDYSLQIELFTQAFNQIPLVGDYLRGSFNFLIYDNCEEDIPVSHDLVRILSTSLQSLLVIYDHDAGYRSFLGASPKNALELSSICAETISFESLFTSSPSLSYLNQCLSNKISGAALLAQDSIPAVDSPISINFQPSYPEMADWVSDEILSLISSDVSPGEIVILAPYLSDSLRFLLMQSLSKRAIPATSHRPSRALRDEPVTQALLTMAAFAHPSWEIHPSSYDLALALMQIIKDLDLTRAYLLADQALKTNPKSSVRLADFEDLSFKIQDRVSFFVGNLYQGLLDWLNSYASVPALPLDHFLTHLFGEILTVPGFGFYNDLQKGRVTSQIIESANKFRLSAGEVLGFDHDQSGKEYFRMVKTGVLANQYIRSWTNMPENEIIISPAYTFLLNNNPVEYQFWLDIGSRGWYERIYQPLTNPYVLQRNWPAGRLWTDEDEQLFNLKSLDCLTTGLIRRCKKRIYGCLTETDERGFEQKGTLLLLLNKINNDFQSSATAPGNAPND